MTRVGFMLVLVGLTAPLAIAEPPAAKQDKDSLRAYVLRNKGRYAYGFYLKGQKVGWYIDELKLGKSDGKDVAIEVTEGLLKIQYDGEKSTMKISRREEYALDGEGVLVALEDRTTQNDRETVRKAMRVKDQLVIKTQMGERTIERRVALPKRTLALERKLE